MNLSGVFFSSDRFCLEEVDCFLLCHKEPGMWVENLTGIADWHWTTVFLASLFSSDAVCKNHIQIDQCSHIHEEIMVIFSESKTDFMTSVSWFTNKQLPVPNDPVLFNKSEIYNVTSVIRFTYKWLLWPSCF